MYIILDIQLQGIVLQNDRVWINHDSNGKWKLRIVARPTVTFTDTYKELRTVCYLMLLQ